MKQYIADAFTDRLFGGNPAAVLPCDKAEALMKKYFDLKSKQNNG